MDTVGHTAGPLVVAVEGLSFAGKSTLARALAPLLGGLVAAEYTDMADLPPFPPRNQADVAAALDHFLRLEYDRARLARAAAPPLVVADRSPLTLISYEFGIAAHGVPAAPHLAARLYSEAAETGRILRPDGYLYLRVTDDVTAARAAERGPIAAHLSHPHVRAGIEATSLRYLATLPASRWCVLDGAQPRHDLVEQAATFVQQLSATPSGPAPTWRVLAEPEPVSR